MSSPMIFLVEPNGALADAIVMYLRHHGYGVEAVEADDLMVRARQRLPALIVGEHPLPLATGEILCTALRSDAELSRIPFLALTSRAMPAELAHARAGHPAGVLTKPVTLAGLLEAVQRSLEVPTTIRGPASPPGPTGS